MDQRHAHAHRQIRQVEPWRHHALWDGCPRIQAVSYCEGQTFALATSPCLGTRQGHFLLGQGEAHGPRRKCWRIGHGGTVKKGKNVAFHVCSFQRPCSNQPDCSVVGGICLSIHVYTYSTQDATKSRCTAFARVCTFLLEMRQYSYLSASTQTHAYPADDADEWCRGGRQFFVVAIRYFDVSILYSM